MRNMPRANRYYLPGHVWHLTERCHNKKFLLEREVDRDRWLYWLEEAKKRYQLCILNYCVTCNHIHLLVLDEGKKDALCRSMQLISGRTAQEYNTRDERKGAFWQGRYNATAIENGIHLARCLAYIELNMVRAGVVEHPSQWKWCSFREISGKSGSAGLVDSTRLASLLELNDVNELPSYVDSAINEKLQKGTLSREKEWTSSVAVGSRDYLSTVKKQLDLRGQYRRVRRIRNHYELSEDKDLYIRPVHAGGKENR